MKQVIIFFIVLLFTGCTTYNNERSNVQKDKINVFEEKSNYISYPFGQPNSSTVKNYRWKSLEGEKKEIARKNSRERNSKAAGALATIIPIIKNNFEPMSNRNDQKIIANIQNELDQLQDREEIFLIEQMTASILMESIYPDYITKSKLNDYSNKKLDIEHTELLNFATFLFVKNSNPNADLIAFNLEKLSGSISENDLKDYALKTIKSSSSWFLDEKNCSGCKAKNGLDEKTKLVEEGVSELKKYIDLN